MPGIILPVKRPQTVPKIYSLQQRDLVALRLHENKRQKSAAGFEMETDRNKKVIGIRTPKENFMQSANPRSDR
jgi:hypothetical protein